MGQAQINVRTRACSRTSIARTRQAALTHNVRGKELMFYLSLNFSKNFITIILLFDVEYYGHIYMINLLNIRFIIESFWTNYK